MRELRLLSTEPVERGTHFRRSGQAGDFLLNRGSDVRHVRALRRGAHGELCVILQREHKVWGLLSKRPGNRALETIGRQRALAFRNLRYTLVIVQAICSLFDKGHEHLRGWNVD